MTLTNYKLPLKHDPYANHLLSWSIVDEIRHGKHSFPGLKEMLLSEKKDNARRYADVLYCKTLQEEMLFHVLTNTLNERCRAGADSISDLTIEFKDWGFSYSRASGRVSQDIKAIKWK